MHEASQLGAKGRYGEKKTYLQGINPMRTTVCPLPIGYLDPKLLWTAIIVSQMRSSLMTSRRSLNRRPGCLQSLPCWYSKSNRIHARFLPSMVSIRSGTGAVSHLIYFSLWEVVTRSREWSLRLSSMW